MWRFLWRRCGLCCQPSLCPGFLPKAAHLTALVDEKELSVREKAEALLQKEQEILQLKKGEESAPGRALSPSLAEPCHPFPPSTPALWRPIREQNSPDSPCPPASPLPGPGHDAALLHTHQLQAELEALRSRRAEESEAAAVREGLLRLPGRGQGLALSDGEPRVSAIGRVPWGSRVLPGAGRAEGWLPHFARRGRQWEDAGALRLLAGVLGTSLPCAAASFL